MKKKVSYGTSNDQIERFRNRRRRFRIQARNGNKNNKSNQFKNTQRRSNNYRFRQRRNFNREYNNTKRKNTNDQKINKITQDINELTNNMNKLSVTNTKLVNKFQSKKEMRTDRLISAMNMSKYSNKIPFYRPSLKTLSFDIYNQISFIHNANKLQHLFWFPYCYPHVPDRVTIWNNVNWVAVDSISTMLVLNNTDTTLGFPKENITAITGDVRLVAATLKITNTSPAINKEGSYTMYLTTRNTIYPVAYAKQYMTVPGALINDFEYATLGNLDLLSTKMLFSASDVGYADEYGVRQGNTIFGSSNEYVGQNFSGDFNGEKSNFARPGDEKGKNNPNGLNVCYIVKFPPTSQTQNYIIETWCVWEVVPSDSSTLGTIAQFPEKTFNKEIERIATEEFPFHK